METVRIDASQKTAGRVASEAAKIIQGKHTPGYRAYKISHCRVTITNTDKLAFSGKKLLQKKYFRHTGRIGHLKEIPISSVFAKDSREVIRHAVRGMLPKNRLLKERMKHLVVYKGEER